MTEDGIIKMAREAGMVVIDDKYSLLPFLGQFAARVYAEGAKTEREACAQLCEQDAETADFWNPNACPGQWFADAIRARGGKE